MKRREPSAPNDFASSASNPEYHIQQRGHRDSGSHSPDARGVSMNTRKSFVVLPLLVFSAVTLSAAPAARAAQDSKPATPAASAARQKAQADISVGDVAAQNGATDEAIADYRAAILADPSDVDAHQKFFQAYRQKSYAFLTPKKIKTATKKPTKEQQAAQQAQIQARRKAEEAKLEQVLLTTYDNWIKKDPRQPMFYWGKAQILEEQNKNPEAVVLLNKALALDPSCAPAWADLSDMAAVTGDVPAQRADAERSLAADPSDSSGVFFNYILTYLTTDPPKYRQLVEDRAAKYPKGLDFLMDLGAQNAPPAEETATLEKIYKIYGPNSANPSDSIDYMMLDLFNLYAKSDPQKALALAQRIQNDEAAQQAKKSAAGKSKADASAAKKLKDKPAEPFWQTVAEYQQGLISANMLLAQKKYADAQALLEKSALRKTSTFDPSGINQDPYELAMAEALAGSGSGSSGAQKAYDRIKTALLPQPNASLENALLAYGEKLGKTPAQIDSDIWQARESKAKPMAPFDLKQYVTDKDIKLADYRGQVVLVNFWFPG